VVHAHELHEIVEINDIFVGFFGMNVSADADPEIAKPTTKIAEVMTFFMTLSFFLLCAR
jgi:hypothetical protein